MKPILIGTLIGAIAASCIGLVCVKVFHLGTTGSLFVGLIAGGVCSSLGAAIGQLFNDPL